MPKPGLYIFVDEFKRGDGYSRGPLRLIHYGKDGEIKYTYEKW